MLSWCSSVAGLFLQREMSNAINRTSFYRLSVAARHAYRRTTVSYVSVISFSTGLSKKVSVLQASSFLYASPPVRITDGVTFTRDYVPFASIINLLMALRTIYEFSATTSLILKRYGCLSVDSSFTTADPSGLCVKHRRFLTLCIYYIIIF